MIKTEEVPFAVVQTIGEGNQVNLTVLPEHWTLTNGWNAGVRDRQSVFWGSDIMYWPINAAGRNLSDVADTDAAVMPDENCRAYRCTIKTIHCNRAEVRILKLVNVLCLDFYQLPIEKIFVLPNQMNCANKYLYF